MKVLEQLVTAEIETVHDPLVSIESGRLAGRGTTQAVIGKKTVHITDFWNVKAKSPIKPSRKEAVPANTSAKLIMGEVDLKVQLGLGTKQFLSRLLIKSVSEIKPQRLWK